MIADEFFRSGFRLAQLPEPFLNSLQQKARAGVITLTNPIDLGDIHDLNIHMEVIEKLMNIPDVDAIIYHLPYSKGFGHIFNYPRMFRYIDKTSHLFQKPLVLVIDLLDEEGWPELRKETSTLVFYSILDALSAMKKVNDGRKRKHADAL